MKNIAVLASGINFEAHAKYIKDLHKEFKSKGDALYVMTCYDATNSSGIPEGDESIYTLATKREYDGYLISDTINNDFIMKYFFESGRLQGKPVVMSNAESEVAPSVELDSYTAASDILSHLIEVHGCKKINFIADFEWIKNRFGDYGGIRAYKSALMKYGIEFDERRLVSSSVGIPQAMDLWDRFVELGIDDCDAVLCYIDIYAIGLYLRLTKDGKKVPEDIKLASMRRSDNSVAFRPDISGAVIAERAEAKAMRSLLYEQINGTMIRPVKMYKSECIFGGSCGCNMPLRNEDEETCRKIVLNKINVGAQIKVMMQFNDSLEKVTSLEEYADNIGRMYASLGLKNYAICINKRDIAYILDADSNRVNDPNNPFDDVMYVMAGSQNGIDLGGVEIETSEISPFDVSCGDMVLLMPIIHKERAFGYVAMLNEALPIEQYNYRICLESLGNSIENLRRQMALKHSLNEMNELRMKDPLTGCYNRESIKSFKDSITKLTEYTIVMMDMDGLKKINDVYGHEEGNRAIQILATSINHALHTGDILARYGGDEFVVMSPMNTEEHWTRQRDELNEELSLQVHKNKLPYKMGVSIGFCVHTPENGFDIDKCFELADDCMYKNKVQRKACRTD